MACSRPVRNNSSCMRVNNAAPKCNSFCNEWNMIYIQVKIGNTVAVNNQNSSSFFTTMERTTSTNTVFCIANDWVAEELVLKESAPFLKQHSPSPRVTFPWFRDRKTRRRRNRSRRKSHLPSVTALARSHSQKRNVP